MEVCSCHNFFVKCWVWLHVPANIEAVLKIWQMSPRKNINPSPERVWLSKSLSISAGEISPRNSRSLSQHLWQVNKDVSEENNDGIGVRLGKITVWHYFTEGTVKAVFRAAHGSGAAWLSLCPGQDSLMSSCTAQVSPWPWAGLSLAREQLRLSGDLPSVPESFLRGLCSLCGSFLLHV